MRYLMISGLALGAIAVPLRSQQSACRPADATSVVIINKLKRLVSFTGGAEAVARLMAGIPQVDPATIVLVTDRTICSKAERAYTSFLKGHTTSVPSGQVYVVKVGTAYVVQDPATGGGEFVVEVVLDASFKVLSSHLA